MLKNTIKNCIRIIGILLAFLLILPLLCCARDTGKTPSETYAPATDPITGERVRVTPKPRPTAPPDFSSEGLSFPVSSARLGNLTGGRIFPEPAEYLVLGGSGGVRYVYSSMGELRGIFQSHLDYTGFYGAYGVCGNFSLKLMDHFPKGEYVLRCADVFVGGMHREDDNMIAVSITDWRCENTVMIEGGGIDLGRCGTLFHVENKYLAVFKDYSNRADIEYAEPDIVKLTLIDQDGSIIGEIDDAPFKTIEGVLGGKYLVCYDENNVVFDADDWVLYDLYDISGNLIEEKVVVRWYNDFSYTMFGDYYKKNGKWYDCEDNEYDAFPRENAMSDIYWATERIELEGVSIRNGGWRADSWGIQTDRGIYAGVVDEEGSWLFKIYSPALDSDSKPKRKSFLFD